MTNPISHKKPKTPQRRSSPLHRLFRLLLLLCLAVCAPTAELWAQKPLTIDADRQYEFAVHCFETEAFGLAVQEYRRFLFFFPDDSRTEKARYQIGMSHFKMAEYHLAVDQFEHLIRQSGESELAVEAYFMISKSYLAMNAPGDAVNNLQNFATLAERPDLRDRAHNAIGWIYIDAGAYGEAKKAFRKISPEGRNIHDVEKVENALDAASSLPKKNPALAAGLSVLPGAGQLYCERYQDALIAVLLNGAMIWATVEAFDKENYALGTLLGAVELGFYTGNIYSAASSAHKYNRRQNRTFIEDLKRNASLGVGITPDGDGMMLSFKYRF